MTKSPSSITQTLPRVGAGIVLPHQRVPVQLCRRVAQILMSVTYEAIGPLVGEVTPWVMGRNQMGLLVTIAHVSGLDQKSLAAMMALDGTTVGQSIDALEEHGLVRRVGSPSDRRVKHVEITPAGKAFVDKTRPKILAAQRTALSCLSDEERETFLDFMVRVIEANAEHDRPGGGRRAPTRATG
jgi:DNA-binding MarR family transcriptional regulator